MPSTDNLLIRADAGPSIGVGHVMRSLALAQQWRADEGRVTFACADLPETLEERLRSEGIKVVIIDAPIGSLEDANETLSLSNDLEAAVVTDGYRFTIDFQKVLHRHSRTLLVLDDFGQIGSYQADLILDQNLGTTEHAYLARPPDCRLLLGSAYAMLRQEFLYAQLSRREVEPVVEKVLVTTGGSNVGDLICKIFEVLNEIPDHLDITVVVGRSGGGQGVLKAGVGRPHHQVRLIENATNMPQLMAEADLAISSAGSTAWELAYLGVPSVLGVIAENQRGATAALVRTGAAVAFDGTTSTVVNELRRALMGVYGDHSRRAKMSEAAQLVVDGKGAKRVVQEVRTMADRSQL